MGDGQRMHRLVERLFPICRSITGDGVRETLSILREYIPDMKIYEVPSGTRVFDWTIPREWRIREAYIENGKGERIIDMKENNLHVMGYSAPMDRYVSLDELKQYIYVQEDQPDAVPYVTSYYKERSGFCMSRNMRDSLPEDRYHMYIDSELFDGSLTYGEAVIPGKSEKEVLLSTYVCHPSMANNELSGPAVAAALAEWLGSLRDRKYTYRIVFLPETIGSITYLSRNLDIMKQRMIAGFVLSCVGDDRTYSYVPSRDGNTLADRAARNVLSFHYPEYKRYTYLDRGSDERQYNAPGVDLPVCVVCRSKYGEYPEYHTSLDDLSLVTEKGLEGALDVYKQMIVAIEYNALYRIKCLCEPQLGKRGLYPTVSQKGSYYSIKSMVDFIAYADGRHDLLEISGIIGVAVKELIPVIEKLLQNGLLDSTE